MKKLFLTTFILVATTNCTSLPENFTNNSFLTAQQISNCLSAVTLDTELTSVSETGAYAYRTDYALRHDISTALKTGLAAMNEKLPYAAIAARVSIFCPLLATQADRCEALLITGLKNTK